MRAIVVNDWTEPAKLSVSEIAEPEVLPGQLGVQVEAAACNFSDILIVQGRYQVKPSFPFTPGRELAGTVIEVGAGVDGFEVGDRIMAALVTGAFAQKVALCASAAFKFPDAMSFEDAAAFPITYPTSYAALVFRAALQAGEHLLVHAAAGGVGTSAVQVGVALGAKVIAAAAGSGKLQIARDQGATAVIDYDEGNLVERVMEITEGKGADVIYDSVGGDITDDSLRCIAWNGRLVVIGFASGVIPAIRANRIMLKNIAVTGLHWPAYETHEPARILEAMDGLFELYRAGKVRPVISKRYALEDVPVALTALAARKTHGKLIITPQSG
jgi:NADPH2:quinone reductase